MISLDTVAARGPGLENATMTDMLIRGVPDDVVAALDAAARRLGISRTEYLRRELTRLAVSGSGPVTGDALREFATTFADLGDTELMRRAWE